MNVIPFPPRSTKDMQAPRFVLEITLEDIPASDAQAEEFIRRIFEHPRLDDFCLREWGEDSDLLRDWVAMKLPYEIRSDDQGLYCMSILGIRQSITKWIAIKQQS